MYCIILLYYNIICVIIILFAGCSVIVGRHDILPCAAPFKSLQGVAVPFSFFFSFKWHCKLLIITLFNKKQSMHTIHNVINNVRVCAPTNSLCTLYTMLTIVRGCACQLMLTSDWLCK